MTWAIFDDSHLRAIAEIIHSGSERVTAIVGGALLDDTLRRTLAERLRDDRDITKKLLKVNGALGNTGPKIDLLYQLYAFGKPERNALYGLTEARNYFAHNLDASFNSTEQTMIDAITKMTLHDNRKFYPHHAFNQDSDHEIEPVTNNREIFEVNLKLCLLILMRDRMSHVLWSNMPVTEDQIRERLERERATRSSHRAG
jgi:hypothetical protein